MQIRSRKCNQTPCQTSDLVPNCETNTVCVWLTASSEILSVVFAVLCSCLLLFIMNCCSQHVWHSLEATWTLSWMFCDHVLMKCYCLHSASGHHVKDKESEVFSNLSEDCGRFQLFFTTESVTLSLLLCPPSPTTPEPWSFPLFSVFKLISFICFSSTCPAFPHPLPLILIMIKTSLCLLLP